MSGVNRKLFLVRVLSSGLAFELSGCGGGGGGAAPSPAPAASPGPPPSPPPPTNCTGLTFSANHGHILVIVAADLSSTATKTYNVQGTADHNHQVTLSPGQLAQLKAGGTVSVATSLLFA